MTDTQRHPEQGPPSWGNSGYSPPPGPTFTRGAPYRPAPPWTGAYPPPAGPPPSLPPAGVPAPRPPRKKGPRPLLRVLLVIAAVVFGLPAALLIGGIIAVAVDDTPSPTSSTFAAPPPLPASAAPLAAAPSPLPEPDPISPYDLAPGDCYNSVPIPTDGSTVRISSVEQVPCSEQHTAQVVDRFTYNDVLWSAATAARADSDCEKSFQTKVSRQVWADDKYQPALIHSDRSRPNLQTVYAACAIATDAPTTGSVLKG